MRRILRVSDNVLMHPVRSVFDTLAILLCLHPVGKYCKTAIMHHWQGSKPQSNEVHEPPAPNS